MSYTPTSWNTGDTITAEKLNKMEQGIAAGGSSGGGLVVNLVWGEYYASLDKTWQEINDTDGDVRIIGRDEGMNGYGVYYLSGIGGGEGGTAYTVFVISLSATPEEYLFSSGSPNDELRMNY